MTAVHVLVRDGAAHFYSTGVRDFLPRTWAADLEGRALCSCGAYSDPLPDRAARHAWHTNHLKETRP